MSPHATIWEHRDVSYAYQIKAGFLFTLFLIFYFVLCFYVMKAVKFYMVSARFNYVYLPQCNAITSMFANIDDYQQWASIDRQYLKWS